MPSLIEESVMYRRKIVAVVSVFLGLVLLAPAALADTPGLVVIPPSASVDQTGKTYGGWSAAWWQHMLAIPADSNPITDSTGANCGQGEAAAIFFLAGAFTDQEVNRMCTVPATKPLFIPIITVECSNVEAEPFFGRTPKARAACAKGFADGVGLDTLRVTLNGVDVANLRRFRAASPDFAFTMPAENNILGLSGVTSGRASADGFYVLLKPPAPGVHTLEVDGAFVSGPGAGFSQHVNYTLTVQ
jgi:hypothetical protein